MAPFWSALRQRLGLAPGKPAPAPASASTGAGERASSTDTGAWDGPPPARDSPPPDHSVPWRSLVYRGRIRRHALAPDGLTGRLGFHGVTIPYFQYGHCNLLLVDDGQRVRGYRPRQRRGPVSRPESARLHRLVCASRPVAMDDDEDLIRVAFPSPDEPPGDDLDLGPALHRELLRLLPVVPPTLLVLLDLLATFEGQGSDEFTSRRAAPGDAGVGRLDALADRSIDTRPAREALRRPEPGRCTAVIEVDRQHDGHVGGYRRETALGTLSVGPRGWSYERRLLHVDEEEGTPMS